MRCPGQDRGYWTEDVVFEVPCPKCDEPVEFFKDESSGRCRSCGHKFRNPRTPFDCAQWCAYAEQCVGFVPERKLPSDPGKGALASRLIQAVKDEFGSNPARLARSLTAFQYARELLLTEGGDPRVILAASLLLELCQEETETPASSGPRTAKAKGRAKATQILHDVGLDEDTIEYVCRLLESYCTGQDVDAIEFRVVQDAGTLTKLAEADRASDPDTLQQALNSQLRTAAAKSKVRSAYPS
jgi:hypothetical protein